MLSSYGQRWIRHIHKDPGKHHDRIGFPMVHYEPVLFLPTTPQLLWDIRKQLPMLIKRMLQH